jgi:hypothetical protein
LKSETLPNSKSAKPAQLTGKKIWESIWLPMNTYITNTMLPGWLTYKPKLSDGSTPSGTQNYEEALFKFRKHLFDLEKNTIKVIEKAVADIKKGKDEEDEDNDEEQEEQEEEKEESDEINEVAATGASTSTAAPAVVAEEKKKKKGKNIIIIVFKQSSCSS